MRTPFILDTDIGSDCDDAGALAMLNGLHAAGVVEMLAVTHCTSNRYGCGCIDAVNRAYGHRIAVGTLQRAGFLDDEKSMRYNRYITENYPNDYRNTAAPPAVRVLRQALASAQDGSVVIAAIGPLPNIRDLLLSPGDDLSPLCGIELTSRKVGLLSVMGGCASSAEYNFLCDAPAAAFVCEHFPGEIWFSTFEVGADIITGLDFGDMADDHPVRVAYRLHSPDGRSSWDQTAVYIGALGTDPFFRLSPPGRMRVDKETGRNVFGEDPMGKHRLIHKVMDDNTIAQGIERMMRGDMAGLPASAARLG